MEQHSKMDQSIEINQNINGSIHVAWNDSKSNSGSKFNSGILYETNIIV